MCEILTLQNLEKHSGGDQNFLSKAELTVPKGSSSQGAAWGGHKSRHPRLEGIGPGAGAHMQSLGRGCLVVDSRLTFSMNPQDPQNLIP